MLCHFFDLETTGTNPDKCSITEFSLLTFDLDRARTVSFESFVVKTNQDIEAEAELHTNLSATFCCEFGQSKLKIREVIGRAQMISPYFIAHNGRAFDLPILKREECLNEELPFFLTDSLTDIEWGKLGIRGRSLNHILADIGYINMGKHEAYADCFALAKIFEHFPELKQYVLESDKDKCYAVCVDQFMNDAQKQTLKDIGFSWDFRRKHWSKMHFRNKTHELGKYLKDEKGNNFSFRLYKSRDAYDAIPMVEVTALVSMSTKDLCKPFGFKFSKKDKSWSKIVKADIYVEERPKYKFETEYMEITL